MVARILHILESQARGCGEGALNTSGGLRTKAAAAEVEDGYLRVCSQWLGGGKTADAGTVSALM